MNETDLARRAGELGVAVGYQDWRGQRVQVPGDTLRAIVAALDGVPGTAPGPAGTAPGPAGTAPGPAGTAPGVT
ncbi:MAG: hypothetical protein ACYCU3_20765, partial [Streptosporangiaceae bacterium]